MRKAAPRAAVCAKLRAWSGMATLEEIAEFAVAILALLDCHKRPYELVYGKQR
jgi:hypothetical protein